MFNTEANYDFLTIDNTGYSGSSAGNHINGMSVTTSTSISFTSDFSITSAGFEICRTLPGSQPPFTLVSAADIEDCEIIADPNGDGFCITDGSGRYGRNEQCNYRVNGDVSLDVREFNIHSSDTFLVDGVRYTGRNGPESVSVSSGDTISWSSDSRRNRDGYMICAPRV